MVMILIDYREQRSGVIEGLQRLGAKYEVVNLAVGDYVIAKDIYIERKSSADFINSLTGGRLFKQLSRPAGRGWRRLLIIEGLPPALHPGASAETIRGALVAIAVSWGIPVPFSECPEETAETLVRIEKQQLKRSQVRVKKNYWGRKAKDYSVQKKNILESMPMVGPYLAQALLDKFGNLEKIFTASEEELLSIKGIGTKKARKIRDLLEEEKAKYKINFCLC